MFLTLQNRNVIFRQTQQAALTLFHVAEETPKNLNGHFHESPFAANSTTGPSLALKNQSLR